NRKLSTLVQKSERRAHALQQVMERRDEDRRAATEGLARENERLKAERNAIALALAAIALQSMGGENADPADVIMDVEAAEFDGQEPIPRSPSVWLQLKYEIDDEGNLTSFSKSKGSRVRPFDGDGARGVAALVQHVARLYNQRTQLRSHQMSVLREHQKMAQAVRQADKEYMDMHAMMDDFEAEVKKMESQWSVPPIFNDAGARDASLTGRLHTAHRALSMLSLALSGREEELNEARAKVLELRFYRELHGKGMYESRQTAGGHGDHGKSTDGGKRRDEVGDARGEVGEQGIGLEDCEVRTKEENRGMDFGAFGPKQEGASRGGNALPGELAMGNGAQQKTFGSQEEALVQPMEERLGEAAGKELTCRERKEDAATKIQARFRGNRARTLCRSKQVTGVRGDQVGEASSSEVSVDGEGVREQGEGGEKRGLDSDIGAGVREGAKDGERRGENEGAAAVKIQAGFRGHRARKEAALRREGVRRADAAGTVQAHYRGHRARKSVAGMREEKKAREEGAATKIQTHVRGRQARARVADMRSRRLASEVRETRASPERESPEESIEVGLRASPSGTVSVVLSDGSLVDVGLTTSPSGTVSMRLSERATKKAKREAGEADGVSKGNENTDCVSKEAGAPENVSKKTGEPVGGECKDAGVGVGLVATPSGNVSVTLTDKYAHEPPVDEQPSSAPTGDERGRADHTETRSEPEKASGEGAPPVESNVEATLVDAANGASDGEAEGSDACGQNVAAHLGITRSGNVTVELSDQRDSNILNAPISDEDRRNPSVTENAGGAVGVHLGVTQSGNVTVGLLDGPEGNIRDAPSSVDDSRHAQAIENPSGSIGVRLGVTQSGIVSVKLSDQNVEETLDAARSGEQHEPATLSAEESPPGQELGAEEERPAGLSEEQMATAEGDVEKDAARAQVDGVGMGIPGSLHVPH
ncbi:unnamed protein product, partial [Ostreobium quekettii]